MENETTRQTPMRRKLIGRKLKLAKLAKGKMVRHQDIVDAVGSPRTLGRLENGHATKLTYPVIGTLCDLYEMPAEEKFELQRLWRLGPETTNWTQPRGRAIFGFDAFNELQSQASVVTKYETTFVPGPLQSESTMRLLFSRNPELDAAAVDEEVRIRTQNQRLFWSGDGPQFHYLMSEAVLRMGCDAEQIARLNEADSLDHATVRYLPFSAGPPSLMHLPFTLLAFPAKHDADVVFVEAQDAYLYFEEAESVQHYKTRLVATDEMARSIKEFKL
ncbi:helix-turn-helix transcriptional regulator [Glycomyces sp. NPDC047010]|uniref:helix-turn-helix domain-containing protein n=1 Tax=Glycomyces sp. NPDC047010 TaxID=3155023 RepID=UPI00340C0281